MNSIAVKRIAWKEFRQQIVFFAVLVPVSIGVTVLASILLDGLNVGSSGELWQWPLMFIGMFAALYAAATGGTLYATEREEGTREFLQRLPTDSRQIRTGKLLVAAGLCAGFLMFATLGAALVTFAATTDFILAFGVAVLEFFAWSWLFSLLLSRPLVAAVLGIGVASAVIQITTGLVNGPLYEPFAMEPYANAVLPRIVIVATVLVIDFWLAGQWLGRSGSRKASDASTRSGSRQTSDAGGIGTVASSAANVERPPRTHIMLGRFFWQALRTSWQLMGVYLLLLALLIGVCFVGGGFLAGFCIPGIAALASIAGVFAFTSDKTDKAAAFLSRHADRPALYWTSHVGLWLTWTVMVNVLAVTIFLTFISIAAPSLITTNVLIGQLSLFEGTEFISALGRLFLFLMFASWVTLGMLFCFAGGQLCSMLIDSRTLAAIAALVLFIPQAIWFALMMISETPLYWSVFPLGLAFLSGGCLATRWWIGNRRSLVRIGGLAVGLLIAWTILAAVVIAKRAYEIPAIDSRVADYRTSLGEPDREILAEMRRKFTAAIDGLERPKNLFGGVANWFRDSADSKPYDTATIKSPFDLENEDEWNRFVEQNPTATMEEQMMLASQYVEDNRDRLKQLQLATQYGAENFEQVLRTKPAPGTGRGGWDHEPPPVPSENGDSRELLFLAFYDALNQGEPASAWNYLRSYMTYQQIYNQVFVLPGGWRFEWQVMFDQWSKLAANDELLLREALTFVQSEVLDPVDERRTSEWEWLAATDGWTHPNMRLDWNQRWARFLENLFPWERQRSRRLINLWTRWTVETMEWFDQRVAGQGDPYQTESIHWESATGLPQPQFENWVDNTMLAWDGGYLHALKEKGKQIRNEWLGYQDPCVRQYRMNMEARKLVELKLATLIWQHEYGDYPADLQQMAGNLIPPDPEPGRYVPSRVELTRDYRLLLSEDGSARIVGTTTNILFDRYGNRFTGMTDVPRINRDDQE